MTDSSTQTGPSYVLSNSSLTSKLATLYTENDEFRAHISQIGDILAEQSRQLQQIRSSSEASIAELKRENKEQHKRILLLQARCSLLEGGRKTIFEEPERPELSYPLKNKGNQKTDIFD